MKMDKKQKRILLIVGGVVLFVALVIIIATRKPASASGGTVSGIDRNLFPLTYGSRGTYVENLQKWIIKKGGTLPAYGVDGIFGTETQNALKALTGKVVLSYDEYIAILKEL
jgi:peptidoglycan hydrolase-like protein with peptidoglycan-binding domain